MPEERTTCSGTLTPIGTSCFFFSRISSTLMLVISRTRAIRTETDLVPDPRRPPSGALKLALVRQRLIVRHQRIQNHLSTSFPSTSTTPFTISRVEEHRLECSFHQKNPCHKALSRGRATRLSASGGFSSVTSSNDAGNSRQPKYG